MKLEKMRRYPAVLLAVSLSIILRTLPALAAHDVSGFDIQGFRLGMTMEEAKKISPTLNIKTVTLPEGVIGYKGEIEGITLYFSSPELGEKLFLIEKVRVYPSQPDARPIFSALQKQYGSPDSSGRDMVRLHSCWGKCYGNHRHMTFELKVVGIKKNSFPMTLKLYDPAMEDANKRQFKERHKK